MGLSLAKALRVKQGDVISFVGGGGKTTSMFRLAAELRASGLRVVTTTTTHIGEDQVLLAPTSIICSELAVLKERLDEFGHCLVLGPPADKGGIQGISPGFIAGLRERSDVDVILVEADGSKSRPFKAPAEHEPVVPEATTILAPIAGINAIGQPLDENHVHRPEIVASISKLRIGDPITAEAIACVLSHTKGGAKQRPDRARLVPILNKADSDVALLDAREVAARLLASPAVDSVAVSSMQQDPPVREVWAPVAGIILAAGQATRFGVTKQMLPWEDTTLVAHAAGVALAAGLDPVIAVLGYEADKVAKAIAGLPVQIILNPEFAAGQSTSLRKGLDALPQRTGVALFLLADQPLVTAEMVRSIVQAHRRTLAPACVPVFEGQQGNPVLFDKSLFPELQALRGDTGGRPLLERYRDAIVAVPASRAALLDIDTPEDYQRAMQIGISFV